jgi:hypothetical protein
MMEEHPGRFFESRIKMVAIINVYGMKKELYWFSTTPFSILPISLSLRGAG